jgi:hypothetical protein
MDQSISAIMSMRKEGKLPDDVYHKTLVLLSYEYIAQGEMLEATAILQLVPLDYYQKVMPEQARQDPGFRLVSYTIAQRLVKAGIVDLTPPPRPNQKPASA